ncbi:MAG: hypothetical protein Q8O40_06670, partial [Chloroflexota bacterium]|nr:hypothetical protein [Chloroflexota bacterium]
RRQRMDVPNYIAALLQPQAGKPTGRKVWSIDLEAVWLPFFTATNVVKATAIPAEALGAPLRLAYERDGQVRFSPTGRPVIRVAKEISDQVKVVRENFIANLQSFTGQVVKKEKDAYMAQLKASQAAGAPIVEKDQASLEEALAAIEAAAQAATTPEPSTNGATPQPDRELVGATA